MAINTLLFVLQALVAVALIGLILFQHGKGADAGAAFGSGSSATVFGSSGSASFLTKLTAGLVFVFLSNSLLLAYLATQNIQKLPTSLLDQPSSMTEQAIPAVMDEQNAELDSDLPSLPTE